MPSARRGRTAPVGADIGAEGSVNAGEEQPLLVSERVDESGVDVDDVNNTTKLERYDTQSHHSVAVHE